MRKYDFIVLEIIGEVSKDIMATAVASAIKKTYPNIPIIISTFHPEIWLHNTDVFRVYKTDTALYFYENYIVGKNTKIFKLDPYNSQEFLIEKKHLIEAWCDICEVPYKNEQPKIFFTAREREVAKKMLGSGEKPIFLIQINGEVGGMPYLVPQGRDFSFSQAEEISDHMIELGYDIVQVTNSPEKNIRGSRPIMLENRLLMATLPFTSKRLFIDSFLQHASAAQNITGVVVWNTLDEERHGYKIHQNIRPKESETWRNFRENFIEEFRMTKTPINFEPPKEIETIHTTESILKALKKQ